MASYVIARLLSQALSIEPTPKDIQRILVLISGSGTNLQALLDASLPGQIIHVLSNRKSAFGLTRAANAGIPTSYHNLLSYKSRYPTDEEARAAYDAELAALILAQQPDLVVCAGWMHILSEAALRPLKEKGVDIINLHPALPGCFDGKDAIQRAWSAFQQSEITETGIMIHHVIGAVDRGEPIIVRKVDMREGESVEELEARMHAIEHEAIVEGTKLVLEERLRR
ncbi:formyl transferase [Tricharina praecox]|uniref:formyl transferase n=1 Tax=Tricharina praecox TaxID=43433 RepID=UPI00221F42C2|nr:formyl transferase [Tricharina praecox]KAI5855896.1 formyl transferase [Tricharina praecox]